ncbi:hypothetical protein D3Z36_05235 [Lachnospiraceae bacterium]|nr:hypothetical protein [Lachnospiraceae bacterium]
MSEDAREIKVKTGKFSLRKGKLKICFSPYDENVKIKELFLKKRHALEDVCVPFQLDRKGSGYEARMELEYRELEYAFWDVVAVVEDGAEVYQAILGGQSVSLKMRLILFPRWYRTNRDSIIYPFVNGSRQFTIQSRKYNRGYDSYGFLWKEYLALLCYFLLKPYWDHKKLWLVCEKFCTMAQDNGLYFFRYCMEELPEQEKKHILYVIDKKAPDYQAVQKYDKNVIQFMSFRYLIYLCAAQYLISTDAIRHFYIWDSPNSVFKVLYQARKDIIFLQHGVMAFKQCHRTYHKWGGNRMKLFVTSSEYEQDIIYNYFEYDREEIIITGLPRWDVLHDTSSREHKEILLMPTWRGWLEDASEEAFCNSEYFTNYEALLKNEELHRILEQYEITLNFYIHPKFRAYIGQFHADSSRIRLIPFGEQPLNQLLMSCQMLITDYSSVAWDVYYQEKPIVFFPFDFATYQQVQGSYMDLEKEAFGDVVHTLPELLHVIRKYVENGFQEEDAYAHRRDYLLPLRDGRNSERIYERIKAAKPGKKLNIREKLKL